VLKLLIAFFMVIMSVDAKAENMSIYDTEVEIDASASSASLAREKAMNEANRQALYAVTNRISNASGTDILDTLNDNQILNFIREVSVVSEKVTDSRYIATLRISINAPVLKTYLSEKNVPITILPQSHIVIVPLYRESPALPPILWGNNNPWYIAWQNNQMITGQITMQPVSDNELNRSILSAEAASSLDNLSLVKVLRNSNGNDIYVAEVIKQPEGIKAILQSPKSGIINSKIYTNMQSDIFETVISDIKSTIMQQLQQQATAKAQQNNKITIIYGYNLLSEWLSLQKTLKNISAVASLKVDAMGSHRVQISLTFTGDTINIQNVLNKHGYMLNDKGDFYIIERIK